MTWKTTILAIALSAVVATAARAGISVGGPPSAEGTIRKRPYATTPTWDHYNGGRRTGTYRKRPYSTTPTWDYESNSGATKTYRYRPYSTTPTWDVE